MSDDTKHFILSFLITIAVAAFFAVIIYSLNRDGLQKKKTYWKDDVVYQGVSVDVIRYDGHDYICYNGYHAGGLTHSESCPCKRTAEKN